MTQAVSLNQILSRNAHQVVGVLIGKNQHRSLPDFFPAAFNAPVIQAQSPGFVFKENKGVSLPGTTIGALRSLNEFKSSLDRLEKLIAETRPDLIVNFLEPLTGLLKLFGRCPVPVISVGHQFMMEHPKNFSPRGFFLQKPLMRQFVSLAGTGSTRVALSYATVEDLPEKKLYIAPPLLRSQLFEQKPVFGDYILVYLVNHGYAADVICWHQAHPDVPIHCFYDKPGSKPVDPYDDKLTFHALDGEKFLTMMAGCRAVVCTAGFESVAEAHYLGKPLLCIPLENHVEQNMNAIEAQERGLGIRDSKFNIDRLLNCPTPHVNGFRSWVDSAEAVFLRVMKIVTEKQ